MCSLSVCCLGVEGADGALVEEQGLGVVLVVVVGDAVEGDAGGVGAEGGAEVAGV